jgi:hypothetical protein
MVRWLQIQLAHGKIADSGKRLYSEAQAKEMWTPHVPMPIEPASVAAVTPKFQSYALGWVVRDWRGHPIIMHTGAVTGMRAAVVLIPEKNVGFAVLENAEDSVPLASTMYELLDHYLDQPSFDWQTALEAGRKQRLDKILEQLNAKLATTAKVGPSLPVARYEGDYADPWYGPISIKRTGDKLTIDFKQSPGMVGMLDHVQYDTFKTRWNDKAIENAYVTFQINAEGMVERITMKAVSPLADFSYDYQDLDFTPVTHKN